MLNQTVPLLRDFVVWAILACNWRIKERTDIQTYYPLLTIRNKLEAILKVENFRDRINQVHRIPFPALISFQNFVLFGFPGCGRKMRKLNWSEFFCVVYEVASSGSKHWRRDLFVFTFLYRFIIHFASQSPNSSLKSSFRAAQRKLRRQIERPSVIPAMRIGHAWKWLKILGI